MAQPTQPNRVMISYNWGSQSFAKDICAKLTEEGYNVWMDVLTGPDDGMKQDIITGMTDGLSKACCMVVILSQKYEESQNCRTELKGAYVRKIPMVYLKHPAHKVNGETLTIMGTSLYQEYDVDPADGRTRVKNLTTFLNEVALHCPLGSPAHPHQKLRILLVGNAGVGKSSIASLLRNGTVMNGLNPGEIYVSSLPVPGTWQTAELENDNYVLVDTMGVGLEDAKLNPFGSEKALQNLKNFLINSRQGYHFIFLVIKMRRNSFAEDVQAYKMFYHGLFPDLHERFVIILTNTPDPIISDQTNQQIDTQFPGISVRIPVEIPCSKELKFAPRLEARFAQSKAQIEDYLKLHKDIKPKVPECSMIERSKFYYYVRKIMNLLGYSWDDDMEKMMISLGMSEKDRNAARLIDFTA